MTATQKKQEVRIYLDPHQLDALTRTAESQQQTRSGFIRQLIDDKFNPPKPKANLTPTYAGAVAEAMRAGRGKLNRVDAEAVASAVIVAMAKNTD